ncbi:uncharacterized protein [Lolium perenne]|uniref:uncharacterized protein isoform X2 n=1 Tax=Lolium perenne TaxID=4522 RepID=UPI003A9A4DFA
MDKAWTHKLGSADALCICCGQIEEDEKLSSTLVSSSDAMVASNDQRRFQADKICLDSMDVQTLRKTICQEVLCFPSLRGYYQAFNTKFLWAINFHLKLVDIGIKRFLELCLESCLMFRTSHACTCNGMYRILGHRCTATVVGERRRQGSIVSKQIHEWL